MVSKIPRSFVDRVVASLLPTREAIRSMPLDKLALLDEEEKGLRGLVERDPIRFFRPTPGGQLAFATCDDPTVRVRGYFAGNKSGKSTIGGVRLLERLNGAPLWDRDNRHYEAKIPSRCCVFAEDFDSHKETTIPTIMSWAPKGFLKKTNRNPAGHIVEMVAANGSIVHFRTYDQGSDKAEGKDWDHVWCDEPPPRDIYTAIYRGLVAHDGQLDITATLLKEAWLWDEAERPSFKIFSGSINDNIWLQDAAKADFLGSLTDEERIVRETGRPTTLTGLIYKCLKDDRPYILPPDELPNPTNCPTVVGIDPHERKPIFAIWAYVTERDQLVVFDYALIHSSGHNSLAQIKTQLEQRELMHLTKPRICVMDPNRGRAKQLGGSSWAETFEDFGYDVTMGDDNIHDGHTAVTHALVEGKLLFSENCRGRGGPIWQMLRYGWEDWASKTMRFARTPREVPKDLYKDFPDIIRYLVKSNIKYDELFFGLPVVSTLPEGVRDRELRAYI